MRRGWAAGWPARDACHCRSGKRGAGESENWGQDQPPFRDTPKPVLGFTASALGFVAAALGFVASALGLGGGGAFSKRKIGA